jgi:SPP1 family predicted phage head-tail adaptor
MKYPLNKRITIQSLNEVSSVMPTESTYSDYMNPFANVYQHQGRALFGESEEYEFSTNFIIRYTSKSKLINNKYRVVYAGNNYSVRGVIPAEKSTEPEIFIILVTTRYGE